MDKIKKLTSQRLFMPVFCLAIMLIAAVIASPDFLRSVCRTGYCMVESST